jgi:glycosyltransferase involved in cell wall biosynthesis
MRSDPPRIVHLPTGTGGHALGLSRAERELGFPSEVIDLAPTYLSYGADRVVDLSDRGFARRSAARLRFLAEAIRRYDVFHFNAGAPAMALRTSLGVFTELPLLKRLGKTIVVTWQGCDVRPRAACHFCERTECLTHDPWRAADAKAMLKYADRSVFVNPDLGPYLPGASFLPYANVDAAAVEPEPLPLRETVTVAHAPTNPNVKGTRFIVDAVQALRAEGLDVELDLITGVPNREALRRISGADILADQLHIGWYGGVAVEAMALGRPVVCHIDEAENPFGDALPIRRATPQTVREALRALVVDRQQRLTLAQRGREFVLRVHDPRAIVRQYYQGLFAVPSTPVAR